MLHFTRAVISLLSMGCLFVSLQLLPFAEATVLIFTVPFIVALLSGPYLKEPLTIHGWTSVFIGFVGVAIILRPDGSFIHLGAIAGLLSAFLQGLIVLSNRYLSRSEDAMSIVLTFHLIATLAILPFVLGDWRSVSLQDGILLVIVGIMGGMGQYFMTLSSQHAAANYILPFMYTSVLWATPIGMFFFGEAYDWTFFLGAALIIGGGLSIVAFMPQKTEKKNNYPSSRSEEEEKDREDFMLGS